MDRYGYQVIFSHGYGWDNDLFFCRWIWMDMDFTNLSHVNLQRQGPNVYSSTVSTGQERHIQAPPPAYTGAQLVEDRRDNVTPPGIHQHSQYRTGETHTGSTTRVYRNTVSRGHERHIQAPPPGFIQEHSQQGTGETRSHHLVCRVGYVVEHTF